MFNKNNSQDILLKTLKECTLFGDFSNAELKALLGISHIRDYAEGEKIFEEGTIGLCFYLIVSGRVKVMYEKESKSVPIREFSQGEFFSEVHLFSESYHTVSCAASEITKLLVLAKPDFEDLIKIKQRVGNRILLKFLEFFGMKLDELYKENRELKLKLHH